VWYDRIPSRVAIRPLAPGENNESDECDDCDDDDPSLASSSDSAHAAARAVGYLRDKTVVDQTNWGSESIAF
jgi:hypothetical protein